MTPSVKDMHACEVGGVHYLFRTPTVYDVPLLARSLTRQGIRNPSRDELRLCALAGIAALAELADDMPAGEAQQAMVEEWFSLLDPIDEDDIDEPDLIRRGEELLRLETKRQARLTELMPKVTAIHAMLERHWPDYRELKADRDYWDRHSAIDIVRLLLLRIGEVPVERDADGFATLAAYTAIAEGHRPRLAEFAAQLLGPGEKHRKN